MTPYGNRKPRGDVKTAQRMQFHRAVRRDRDRGREIERKGERQMENGMSNKREREKKRKRERERDAGESARLLDEQQS